MIHGHNITKVTITYSSPTYHAGWGTRQVCNPILPRAIKTCRKCDRVEQMSLMPHGGHDLKSMTLIPPRRRNHFWYHWAIWT